MNLPLINSFMKKSVHPGPVTNGKHKCSIVDDCSTVSGNHWNSFKTYATGLTEVHKSKVCLEKKRYMPNHHFGFRTINNSTLIWKKLGMLPDRQFIKHLFALAVSVYFKSL
ncbi:uncharacterized protein LOC112128254 [Cimex lectularius]|uniref:Uncharacterized protein n=1 Tax=Cimex lectularius TaxID=79782 RepID=A0A8I6SS11_CIMLE|nr:uncharacterized protein LOC112128254 [Cimex lectularius]